MQTHHRRRAAVIFCIALLLGTFLGYMSGSARAHQQCKEAIQKVIGNFGVDVVSGDTLTSVEDCHAR